jgi:hypothetical protein
VIVGELWSQRKVRKTATQTWNKASLHQDSAFKNSTDKCIVRYIDRVTGRSSNVCNFMCSNNVGLDLYTGSSPSIVQQMDQICCSCRPTSFGGSAKNSIWRDEIWNRDWSSVRARRHVQGIPLAVGIRRSCKKYPISLRGGPYGNWKELRIPCSIKIWEVVCLGYVNLSASQSHPYGSKPIPERAYICSQILCTILRLSWDIHRSVLLRRLPRENSPGPENHRQRRGISKEDRLWILHRCWMCTLRLECPYRKCKPKKRTWSLRRSKSTSHSVPTKIPTRASMARDSRIRDECSSSVHVRQ